VYEEEYNEVIKQDLLRMKKLNLKEYKNSNRKEQKEFSKSINLKNAKTEKTI
jgi:hypothetical protein